MSKQTTAQPTGQSGAPVITVTKLEYSARLSEETACFHAVILVDGEPVIEASNRGQGGATELNAYVNRNKAYLNKTDAEQKDLIEKAHKRFNAVMDRLTAYADTLPKKTITYGEQSYDIEQDVESLIMDQVNKSLELRDLKGRLSRRVMIYHNDGLFDLKLKASDYNKNKAGYGKSIEAKWPGAKILNDMQDDAALELFQKGLSV